MRPVSPSARIADQSGPLPQFSIFDLGEEQDELTIRRDFAPKSPPRVAIETTDADATWKWQPVRADSKGKFAGVALPLLDGKHALEFDHSEVEITREMVSPFAMREVAKPLELRRRPRPAVDRTRVSTVTSPNRTTALIAACAVLALAIVAVLGFIAHRSRGPIAMRMTANAIVETPLELPPIPVATAATMGSIVPTVKGHRLYLDGKLVGDSAGAIAVPCGQHTIKVGTAGVSKSIAVPCGGELAVSP